jgi:hypothetical protein
MARFINVMIFFTWRMRPHSCRSSCRATSVSIRSERTRCVATTHSTAIFAVAVSSIPLSPVHRNSSVPLSVATVWNMMNGFAEMA